MRQPVELPDHLVRFARLLRGAGMPIGPARVVEALRALEVVDVTRRDEFYWALHAVLVHRGEDRELFRAAFDWFWREPGAAAGAVEEMLATSRLPGPAAPSLPRRLAEAVAAGAAREPRPPAGEPPEERETSLGYSPREVLRRKDFEEMSARELEEAREAIRRLRLPVRELPGRRHVAARRAVRPDPRRTFRASLRAGGGHIPLRWREPRRRPPPVVALLDVSGSMGSYTRMLLHFLHALGRDREPSGRLHAFLFGTRLTDVSRHLRRRDPDDALGRIAGAVEDWGGGTRIGASLGAFNRRWARRVLAGGALVLLMTDGLDREGGEGIAKETARLRRGARSLVWLNPLLRYEDFEPRAAGVRALLPHVDEMRPVHDLESLEALVDALSGRRPGGGRSPGGLFRGGPGAGRGAPGASPGGPARRR